MALLANGQVTSTKLIGLHFELCGVKSLFSCVRIFIYSGPHSTSSSDLITPGLTCFEVDMSVDNNCEIKGMAEREGFKVLRNTL